MSGWQVKKLSEVAKIFDGTHQTPMYMDEGIPFYSVEHVTSNNFSKTKYIAPEVYARENQRVKIQRGDILMTRIGDIGTARLIDWDVEASFYVSLALIKCKSNFDSRFVSYAIGTSMFQKELWRKSLTVAFPYKINLGDIGKCGMAMPEIVEQQRIVSVLQVWDDAIDALERSISAKKSLRVELRRSLLSGTTRLHGFEKQWEEVELGRLCKIKTGAKDNQDKVPGGVYPFFVRSAQVEQIDSYAFDGEAILVPGEGNIGKIFHYINGKFNWHQRVYKISDFSEKALGKYIYFYFQEFFSKQVSSRSVKATVESLRLPTFTKFLVNLPPLNEQQAITAILSLADDEIIILEQQLVGIKAQRKYLLNNLVTGKIRVPETLKPLAKEPTHA